MSTDDGILWESRGQASENYFNDYSFDWEDNLTLLTDVRKLADDYGDYIMIAYPIMQNFVSDTYYRNPDVLVQDKGGDRDLSRMLSDVFTSILADSNSEQKMQHSLFDQSWAGFGVVMPLMRQKTYRDGEEIVPEWQRIMVKSLSPWKVRFDPRGREWDLSDHAYVAIRVTPSLSQIMKWPWMSDEDRRRIIAWNRMGMRDSSSSLGPYEASRIEYAGENEETDPDIIPVPIWMYFDRTKKLVFYQPAGSRFCLTPQPWDEELAEADTFPIVYMAKNREPERKDGRNGFIGIPDVRLIKPELQAIRRLDSQFIRANQNAIFKYVVPRGFFKQEELDKLSTDKQKEVVFYDKEEFESLPMTIREKISVKDLIQLVPQPDLQETRHLVGIKHKFDMIAQILGQSTGDRGGMPVTETATDARIVNERLNQRLISLRHDGGKHFMSLVRLIYLMVKQYQVLPISYQMTTQYNEKVWSKFSADKIRELDLHFDYSIASTQPKTREEQFALHERFLTLMITAQQVQGDRRPIMLLAREMAQLLGIRNVEKYFNDVVIDLLKELAAIMHGIQSGELSAADPNVVARQIELTSQILNEMLTADDLASAMASAQNAPEPESGGGGSIAAVPSPGERAFDAGTRGASAAGAVGGMSG